MRRDGGERSRSGKKIGSRGKGAFTCSAKTNCRQMSGESWVQCGERIMGEERTASEARIAPLLFGADSSEAYGRLKLYPYTPDDHFGMTINVERKRLATLGQYRIEYLLLDYLLLAFGSAGVDAMRGYCLAPS